MVYIIVLNWNNAEDTILCLQSLQKINNSEAKIVLCDNNSKNESYNEIKSYIKSDAFYSSSYQEFLDISNSDDFIGFGCDKKITLLKHDNNYGFAGGNNIGIKFALAQDNAKFIWLLNNDTEILDDSLYEMEKKFINDPLVGLCGSKMVYAHDKERLQGLGGIISPLTCATKHYKSNELSSSKFDDDDISANISYVIGASMLFSVKAIREIGLLCEDYFLYYEEIDICNRLRKAGYKISVASNSVVYHKEGGTTKKTKNDIADYCSVKNRVLIAKKFYPRYVFFVKLSLFFVIFNRIKRKEFERAVKYFSFFLL